MLDFKELEKKFGDLSGRARVVGVINLNRTWPDFEVGVIPLDFLLEVQYKFNTEDNVERLISAAESEMAAKQPSEFLELRFGLTPQEVNIYTDLIERRERLGLLEMMEAAKTLLQDKEIQSHLQRFEKIGMDVAPVIDHIYGTFTYNSGKGPTTVALHMDGVCHYRQYLDHIMYQRRHWLKNDSD